MLMTVNYSYRVDPTELYHYGVKGMKWGVRRDVELLANHRRNAAIKSAKKDYRKGNISKNTKKAAIKQAKLEKKTYMNDVKKNYESLNTKGEKKEASKNFAKQAANEVPRRTLVKGLKTVNNVLAGINIGSNAVSAGVGLAVMPSIAPVVVSSMAGYTLAVNGARYLLNKGFDKLS